MPSTGEKVQQECCFRVLLATQRAWGQSDMSKDSFKNWEKVQQEACSEGCGFSFFGGRQWSRIDVKVPKVQDMCNS
jgi:hypothetical protein